MWTGHCIAAVYRFLVILSRLISMSHCPLNCPVCKMCWLPHTDLNDMNSAIFEVNFVVIVAFFVFFLVGCHHGGVVLPV